MTRILIVDDHPSFRRLASQLVVAAGYAVVGEAADAASALDEAARLRPDVVLLDVVLPDRSGLAVAGELVSSPDPPQVVLISSRSRSDFGESYEWPEGCSFLPKHELTVTRLKELVRQP